MKHLISLSLLLCLMLGYGFAYAEPLQSHSSINWLEMTLQLLGGLALFLFGLDLLIKGLLAIAGDRMKNWLGQLTTNRIAGAFSGAAITAVIQSSSITTVLVVGFVSAGLISLSQAASVIMGANLGTTITAQIVAFKVYNLALLMVFTGFVIQFVSETNYKKNIGHFILGLGLLFIGMNLMGEGMSPLRDYQPFLKTIQELNHPLYGILVGIIFTALIQSSSATIGIVIVMANQGFLTLPTGIALSMGADIGTCVTAILASIGQSRDAIRAAIVHVLFNVSGVLIWLPFIGVLAAIATYVTPIPEGIDAMTSLAANTPREIANANTLFKLSALLLFLPLLGGFIWLIYKLVPILKEETQQTMEPKFLDDNFVQTPLMAFDAVKMELNVFREKLNLLFQHFFDNRYPVELRALKFEEKQLAKIKAYHHLILLYVSKISQSDFDEKQQQQYIELVSIINILESVLETVENGILNARHQMFEYQLKISPTMQELLGDIYKEVTKSLDHALLSIDESQKEKAQDVIASKPAIDHMIQVALQHQVKLLHSDESRIILFRMEMQMVDALKRIHTLSKRIARLRMTEFNSQTG